MSRKIYIAVTIGVVLLTFFSLDADAQCGMCKAIAEDGVGSEDGASVAGGLNTGILYLMGAPYLIMAFAIVLAIIFRKKLVGFYHDFRDIY